MLDPVIHKMITYVQNLEEKDLKDKVGFFTVHSLSRVCTLNKFCIWIQVLVDKMLIILLYFLAPSQYSRPVVSHQAAVHEVPKGPGHCGGRSSARHAAAHAQNPPFLYQDELPQRGQLFEINPNPKKHVFSSDV